MYEIIQDIGQKKIKIASVKTLKEATRLAKEEAIERVDKIAILYQFENGDYSRLIILYDHCGNQW